MIGQTIVGIHQVTQEIIPISAVDQVGLRCECICHDCKGLLVAVINTPARKHFRHHVKANCNPNPETELHLLAKKIILENQAIHIPGRGMTTYLNPVAEIFFNDLIPDVTVQIDGMPFYIEIVVTNPLSILKELKYGADASRVLVIDLGAEDRELSYEALKLLILSEIENKEMLRYQSAQSYSSNETDNGWLLAAILGGIIFVCSKVFFRKKKVRRNYRK